MPALNFNIVFVIWRESIEALLVIGVLNAWLAHRAPDERRAGQRWLWGGVAVGLLGAVGLAALLIGLGDALSDDAQEYFQAAVVFVAAALIVQMVFWMRRSGRTLKADLHASLDRAASQANWLGVFTLAALAVLREGSEAAVFLYGTMASVSQDGFGAAAAATLLGLTAAFATYALLQAGSRILSWRTFFRVTEIMLLCLAASLVVSGFDHLVSLGLAPSLSGRLWDSSRLLPDSGAVGGLFSGLTGYRAKPVLLQVLVFAAYWSLILWFLYRPNPTTRS